MSKADLLPNNSEKVRSTWPIYAMAALVAALVGGTIGYSFVGESLVALGIPDPGAVTTFGLPFFRAMAWILAALSIGAFLFSAFLIAPDTLGLEKDTPRGEAPLTVDGHIAQRTGAVSALCFAAVSLLMVPLVLSDTSGTSFVKSLDIASWTIALTQVATSQVWMICAVLGLVLGVVALIGGKWGMQPLYLLGAICMIVPLGMEGHNATGGAHDYGTNAYLWHLIFMAIWIGGLLALIAHGRRLGPGLLTAVKRYSAVALFAIIVVALSGIISALIRIQPTDLFTTRYGLIIVAKMVGVIVLGLFGFAHRQATIPQLGRKPGAFIRLSIGEVVVMAAVAGIAVTMGRTPPPPPVYTDLTSMDVELGYKLYEAPTFFNVFTMWRFDILFGTLGVLLAGYYLWGVYRLKKRGESWSKQYTAWWLVGCVSLVITMSSGIGMHIPASYSMHMTGHMILSMIVPVFLVLGAPLRLVMTVWEPGTNGEFTPNDWAQALINSRLIRVLTKPWVNLIQFFVFFYALYLYIPLYELAISEHAGHVIMNFSFIISGYIYFWEVVGKDPLPARNKASVRILWLVGSMPVHLFLGVYLMQLNIVMGEEFYLALQLPWHPDLLADQKNGGGIAWGFGFFPLNFALVLLAIEWWRDEKQVEREVDAKLDAAEQRRGSADIDVENADPDDELAEYNAMLARLRTGKSSPASEYYSREFDSDK